MSSTREFELIKSLAAIHAASRAPSVVTSIGDDAAVLSIDAYTVWTVDVQAEHVHFERAWLTAEDLGFRAHAAATSDVLAMGAVPVASLASYILPAGDGVMAEGLARGAEASARAHGGPVVGGNLSRGASLSVTTTVLGRASRAVLRSGARVGDLVLVAGHLGYAALGLHALMNGLSGDSLGPFIQHWRRPELPVYAALSLDNAHAAIDISDGLAQDLGHVLSPALLGAILDEDALVDDALRDACAGLQLAPLDLALAGGEDYALVCTARGDLPGFRRIGVVTDAPGIVVCGRNGACQPWKSAGHEHEF